MRDIHRRLHSHRRHHRHAVIIVGLVIVLALAQLLIVSVIHESARETSFGAVRLEAVSAFYAAEAGLNLSLREVALGSDEDGDGGIGSISDNGLDDDDPALGQAGLSVSAVDDGTQIILISHGRCRGAMRRLSAAVE